MICSRIITRFIHLHKPCMATEKSPLATLRKKTGYTFANCKRALEMHNNDIKEAEKWLKQQAQSLGWSKATKLEGRQTTQGLVGVTVNKDNAALVEINCETDFVARNKEFHKIVEEAARSCLIFTQHQAVQANGLLTKICLDSEQLKSLQARDGKSLADHLALMIGTVGENASLKRAFCLKAQGVHLAGYAHPSGNESNNVLVGKFGGLVAIKQSSSSEIDLEKVGKEICQHIVGMNPKKIGTSSDKPSKEKDDETCLIHQEFLLDDSITVKDFLEANHIEVVDFKRFECGESTDQNIDQPLELVETCQ